MSHAELQIERRRERIRGAGLAALVVAALLLWLAAGCASSHRAPAPDAGGADSDAAADGADVLPTLTVPLAGEIEPGVWRELVTVDAPAPPSNPESGAATPAELNRARFLRYRSAEAPRPVRAIVVGMPGMPAGAMAFDQLARRLVRLSGGEVEVWAIDRRANLLEDLTGMQAAEAARDPDLAWRYYDEGLVIGDRRYAGPPRSASYVAEWGLATAIADLRTVLALIPAERRRAQVVLAGHSFGAALAQAYAAWDIGGKAGAADLAGLILLDGGLHLYATPTEQQYLEQGYGNAPGLSTLRAGQRVHLDFFGFGTEVFMTVEVTALRAWLAPRQQVDDRHTRRVGSLLFLRPPPPMTAAAMVGFALDEATSPMPGMRATCGAPDGPLEPYTSIYGEQRWRPASSDRLYDWIDHDQVDPPEKTSVALLARVAHEGPTNRVEWYMPSRLLLDTAAVSRLDIDEQRWQWRYDLRASRNAEMDAPVLAVLAGLGLVRSAAALEYYRASIASEVGADRPRAGASRAWSPGVALAQQASGFAVLDLQRHAHDDIVHAGGAAADAEVYSPLLQWVMSNVHGSVSVPAGGR